MVTCNTSVPTSTKNGTSFTEDKWLMMLRKYLCLLSESYDTHMYVHYVSRMQNYLLLKQVVHIVTTGLSRVNTCWPRKRPDSLSKTYLVWTVVTSRFKIRALKCPNGMDFKLSSKFKTTGFGESWNLILTYKFIHILQNHSAYNKWSNKNILPYKRLIWFGFLQPARIKCNKCQKCANQTI